MTTVKYASDKDSDLKALSQRAADFVRAAFRSGKAYQAVNIVSLNTFRHAKVPKALKPRSLPQVRRRCGPGAPHLRRSCGTDATQNKFAKQGRLRVSPTVGNVKCLYVSKIHGRTCGLHPL